MGVGQGFGQLGAVTPGAGGELGWRLCIGAFVCEAMEGLCSLFTLFSGGLMQSRKQLSARCQLSLFAG